MADPMIERCATCNTAIGDGQLRNVIWCCDETAGDFCGNCFGAIRCEERHGEGCATMIVCEPADGAAHQQDTPQVRDAQDLTETG